MRENYMPNKPKDIHSPGYHRLIKRLTAIAQSEDDEVTELSSLGEMDLSAYNGDKLHEPAISEMAEMLADAYSGYGTDITDEEIELAVDEACRQSGHNLYLNSDVSLKEDRMKLIQTIARIHEKVASILGGRIRKKSRGMPNLIDETRRRIDKSTIVLLTRPADNQNGFSA